MKRSTIRLVFLAVVIILVWHEILHLSTRALHLLQPQNSLNHFNPSDQDQLATLLGIPSYIGIANHNTSSIDTIASTLAKQFPDSILSRYRAFPSVCATQPFLPYLRQAVDSHTNYRKSVLDLSKFEASDTLLIHLDFIYADHPIILEHEILHAVNQLAYRFTRILVLISKSNSKDVLRIPETIKETISRKGRTIPEVELIFPENEDDSVVMMSRASHLLIHKGPVSALGALVNMNTVYYTPLIDDYMQTNQFRWLVKDATRVPYSRRLSSYSQLNLMGPVVPNCCTFDTFGIGDEEKVVCSNAASFRRNQCWIMSVGCNGKWGFEEAIVEQTNCKVHTFDCTGNWNVPENLKGRVFFHRLCLGQKRETRKMRRNKTGDFRPIRDLIEIGSRESGFDDIVLPALAKVDIEGFEYMALRAMLEQEDKSFVPEQLAIEIHIMIIYPLDMFVPYRKNKEGKQYYIVKEEDMKQFFEYLSSHGYELVHRADNPHCKHCSEITMVKRHALPSST